MKIFKKIWLDPVFSKVISGIILLFIGYLLKSTFFETEGVLSSLCFIATLKIDLWIIAVILLLSLIIGKITKNRIGISDKKSLERDKEIYVEFKKVLSYGFINGVLKKINFSDLYNMQEISSLRLIWDINNGASFSFSHKKLDLLKEKLYNSAESFLTILEKYSSPVALKSMYNVSESNITYIEELTKHRNELCKNYSDFVKLADRILI